jgi:hypothetical protein
MAASKVWMLRVSAGCVVQCLRGFGKTAVFCQCQRVFQASKFHELNLLNCH